jgi:hypothetical protein
MEMTGEQLIPAARTEVRRGLNDPQMLKRSRHPTILTCWSRWPDGGNFSRDVRGTTAPTTCQSGNKRL